MIYLSVILPLKVDWEPVYCVDNPVMAGTPVRVVFARREYIGVVHHIGVKPDCDLERVQKVEEVLTGFPPVSPEELAFWEFLSNYYLCGISDVFRQAFPMLKIRGEFSALAVTKRKDQARVRLSDSLEHRIIRLQDRIGRKTEALFKREQLEASGDSRVRKGVAEALKRDIDKANSELSSLMAAYDELQRKIQSSGAADAAGRTVSKPERGKPEIILAVERTKIYESHIREAVDMGLDVLLLVPEISAGERIAEKMSGIFGDRMLLFTSRSTQSARYRATEALRTSARPYLTVGTRAALFLPFRNLGLVIVDNEQDISYKQTDTNPRFNARDAALALARIHGAKVLLGTSCPSLETIHNSLSGKYGPLSSDIPVSCLSSPMDGAFTLIDIGAERRKNGMIGVFSRELLAIVNRSKGEAAFIYGWENPEELRESLATLLPGRGIALMSFPEARRCDLSRFSVVAVLQADFLTGRDEFRTDERAYQTLHMLMESVRGRLLVQTVKPCHQVFSLQSPEPLLFERRQFMLPPFSRIVDIRISHPDVSRLERVTSALSDLTRPSMAFHSGGGVTLRFILDPGTELAARKRDIRNVVLRIGKEMHFQGHIAIDVDPA